MADETRVAPLIRHEGAEAGWRVCEEGAALLREINEPLVVIAIAGMYRTGKSFLLNCLIGATGGKPALNVGSTSESCTRGIDLCVPPTRLEDGSRLVLLDTEGLASMEQDEAYDAQVFALGLLLSSHFVLNSMGVLDEAAIDRLYLISELSKHVCVRADAGAALGGGGEEEHAGADAEADLAQFFPPLLWVLRDFVVELVSEGKKLSSAEYMEKALEARPLGSRRADERNRVRAAIRTLFPKRACVTLVRPAADEEAVRHAVRLAASELRPEFVQGLETVQRHLLRAPPRKKLFGAELTGVHLCALAGQYVSALNTDGVVPSIRGAWEYVVADSCRGAREAAARAHAARLAAALDGRPGAAAAADADADAAAGAGAGAEAEAEAEPPAAPVRDVTELLLRVAMPSAIRARREFRQAAIAGAEAEAALAYLEAEIAEADARALERLGELSRAECEAAAAALADELDAACAARDADAPRAHADGGGADAADWAAAAAAARAIAVDALPRAVRTFAEAYGSRAAGPAKADSLGGAVRGRVSAAVAAAGRSLDEARAAQLRAEADARRSEEVRAATAEAQLEAKAAALADAAAARDAARAEVESTRGALEAERAARAAAEAQAAASARAHAAELAAARAELDGARATAATQLAEAGAERARAEERAEGARREGEAALARERELGERSRADADEARAQLAAANEAMREQAALAAQASADARAADERHRAQLAEAEGRAAAATARDSTELSVLLGELRTSDGALHALGLAAEESRSLKQSLAEFHERLAVLPDFYVQQVFCSADKPSDLIDALAPDSDSGIGGGLEELSEAGLHLAEAHLGNIATAVSSRLGRWFGRPEGAPGAEPDADEYTAADIVRDMRAESEQRAAAAAAAITKGVVPSSQ